MESKYKYNEIMDHVNIDDEMRKRILANISEANLTPAVTPIKPRKSAMTTVLKITPFIAAAAVLAIVIGGNFWKSVDDSSKGTKTEHVATAATENEAVSADFSDSVDSVVNAHNGSIFGIDDEDHREYHSVDIDIEFPAGESADVDSEEAEEAEEAESVIPVAVYEGTEDGVLLLVTLYSDGNFTVISADGTYSISGRYVVEDDTIIFSARNGREITYAYTEDAITDLSSDSIFVRK